MVGVDLGQRVDPSAIAVVEATQRPTKRTIREWVADPFGTASQFVERPDGETIYTVRHLERLPLGTLYRDVGRRLARILDGVTARLVAAEEATEDGRYLSPEKLLRRAQAAVWVLVDETGVGVAAVETVREEIADTGVSLTGVTFYHGTQDDISPGRESCKLGKARLVSRMQALLQDGRVRLPKTAEAKALADELAVYEIKIDDDGHDKYGAFKVGTHDDLVTALGLACMHDPKAARLTYARGLWD